MNNGERINLHDGVTEVHVTFVKKGKTAAFKEWSRKINDVESTFHGFKKVYVQPPSQPNGSWVTLLQFDTEENLDRWLNSPQRRSLLKESQEIMESHTSHRLFSSFDGWFSTSLSSSPPKWKETMLILLMLFPIVMLEYRYLSPLLEGMNLSLQTFIGNTISVCLLSWPLIPIGIYSLRWWLSSKGNLRIDLLGIGCVVILYLFTIYLFW